MLASFTTGSCNIEFYARELCRRVLRPCIVILSFMPARYVVEFYDCLPGCRVSWPLAKNDESAGHVIKCEMCWPRAKNDESAGHVLKCWGSFNDYNHNIHASNNAFLKHYHLLAYKEKLFFVHNYPEPSILMLMKNVFVHNKPEPSILMLLNENKAYSCFFVPETGSFDYWRIFCIIWKWNRIFAKRAIRRPLFLTYLKVVCWLNLWLKQKYRTFL